MNRERIIALWYFYRQNKKRNRRRRFWVHPIVQKRNEFGSYVLYEELRSDENKFFNYFRMSVSSFEELHTKLQPVLQRQNTHLRNCISPREMIAVTIRYLATGCTFTDLHYTYRMGISTISYIVRAVCTAIIKILQEECIPVPTKDMWKKIADGFEQKANFPHCMGAVDGKHIRIIKPSGSGSLYFNYKTYFSVVLMAVTDSNYKFIYVQVGAYGKDCDSSIFRNSNLWKRVEDGSLDIPCDEPLTGTNNIPLPYFFLGDEGFALHKHLLRPFGGNMLDIKKRIFNYRHCRARRYVECSFGILSNKWRIFHRPLNVDVDLAVDIVKACTILHNFVRDRDGIDFDDTLTINGVSDLAPQQSVRGGIAANNIRNDLANYFLTDGAVPWQINKI